MPRSSRQIFKRSRPHVILFIPYPHTYNMSQGEYEFMIQFHITDGFFAVCTSTWILSKDRLFLTSRTRRLPYITFIPLD